MSEPRSPESFHTGANLSPLSSVGANLRQRPLGRASTTAATTFPEAGPSISSKFSRRNSALSDTVSEARQSIRDSTDDLLFPRAKTGAGVGLGGGAGAHMNESPHDSHWQSAPLALALLPAVGGLFFHNGSAFVTDATLLILAAIFLNWSVRLPWNWYRSAQEIRQPPPESILSHDGIIMEEQEDEEGDNVDSPEQPERKGPESSSQAAIKELHMHEIAALISCFVFPLIGAWLLHAVRGALSRPSEGLVSNYNLTIFILAAEIRPFAHLLRMVQGRTLYLQRVVAAAAEEGDEEGGRIDHNKILDLATRLEDLEAHVADKAAETATNSTAGNGSTSGPEGMKPELVAQIMQIIAEVRHSLQPELDALNRAMRRYEKRTASMAYQIDTRMNQIETQVGDAIALAAAAQQSATDYRQGFVGTLLNWLFVIPARMMVQLVSLPGRVASACLQNVRALLTTETRERKNSKGKQSQAQTQPRPRSAISERRYIATPSAQGSATSGIRSVKKGS